MIRFVTGANDEQRHEMPKRYNAVLRTIGALDSILSIFGLYLFLDPILRGLLALNAAVPNFRSIFVAMILSNGFLLLLFFFAAVQLLRLKRSGVTAHTTASVLLVAYDRLIAAFWAMGGRIGMSIAAATGVGNLGIAPFNLAPYVYPVASTVLLLIVYRRRAVVMQTQRSIA